jgi:hypothetical protein
VPGDIPGSLLGVRGIQARNLPGTLTAGETVAQTLRLGPGRWDLSLQYVGALRVTVRGPGVSSALAANTDLIGPWWSAGTLVTAGGPVTVSVTARANSAIDVPRIDLLGAVAATPLGPAPTAVPLSGACGRYVDSYVTG